MRHAEYTEDELADKARHYCVREEQCVSNVIKKLKEWGATNEVAESVVEKMCDERFIDERRFARSYCSGKLRIQHWGRIKIAWGLRSKGINNSLIEECLNEIDSAEYYEVLRKVARNKRQTLKEDTPESRRKLTAFLLSRGFDYDEIKHVEDTEE